MRSKSEQSVRLTLTPGQVLARRVKSIRARRGMTQQDLADALAAIGYPTHRLTIAKIEKGGTRAENAPLREVLALAAALSVAPVHLLAPLEDDAAVEITPALVALAPVVREWIRGRWPLPIEGDIDAAGFLAEMPRSELLEMMRTQLRASARAQLTPLEYELVGDIPAERIESALRALAAEMQAPAATDTKESNDG